MISNLSRTAILLSVSILLLGIMREIVHQTVGFPDVFNGFRHINLDSEHSVPAWWSSAMMFASAVIMYAFSRLNQGRGLYHSTIWFPLAVVFFFLSLDEAAGFHESIMEPLRNLLDLQGIIYFAWVIPAFFALIGFGLIILRPFLALPRTVQIQFAICGVIYVSGAMGMELIGGNLTANGEGASAAYSLSIIIEEGMEIIGLTLFLLSLCRQLDDHALPVILSLAGDKEVGTQHRTAPYHPDPVG